MMAKDSPTEFSSKKDNKVDTSNTDSLVETDDTRRDSKLEDSADEDRQVKLNSDEKMKRKLSRKEKEHQQLIK